MNTINHRAVYNELMCAGYAADILHRLANGPIGFGGDIVAFIDKHLTDLVMDANALADIIAVGVVRLGEIIDVANATLNQRAIFLSMVTQHLHSTMSAYEKHYARAHVKHSIKSVYDNVNSIHFGTNRNVNLTDGTYPIRIGLDTFPIRAPSVRDLPSHSCTSKVAFITSVNSVDSLRQSAAMAFAVRECAEVNTYGQTTIVIKAVCQRLFECNHPKTIDDAIGVDCTFDQYMEALGFAPLVHPYYNNCYHVVPLYDLAHQSKEQKHE